MAIGIHCCEKCVPPKRHSKCHATCKDYKDDKAQLEKDKAKAKSHYNPRLSVSDFNKTDYVRVKYKNRKHKK